MRFKAITFDCYGTLIDWDAGVGAFLGQFSDVDALLGDFADAQRRHQTAQPFKPYRQVLHDACVDMARKNGIEADAEAFADSVGGWPPFADTLPTLRRLAGDHVLGVVSNVDDLSFERTQERLDGLIDEVVTADTVENYKPGLAHFRCMLERLEVLGIGGHEVLHAAQSRFHDVAPAKAIGLKVVWVDRRHARPGRGITVAAGAEPDFRVNSLEELVSRLGLAAGSPSA